MRRSISLVLLFVLIVTSAFSTVALAGNIVASSRIVPKDVYFEEHTTHRDRGIVEISPRYWVELFSFPEILEWKVSESGTAVLLFVEGEWVEFDFTDYDNRGWGNWSDPFVQDEEGFFFLNASTYFPTVLLLWHYYLYDLQNIIVMNIEAYETEELGKIAVSGDVYIPVRLAKEKWETYFPKSTVTFEGEGDGAKCTVKAPGKRAKEIDRKGEKGINLLVVDGEQYITPYIYSSIIGAAAGY